MDKNYNYWRQKMATYSAKLLARWWWTQKQIQRDWRDLIAYIRARQAKRTVVDSHLRLDDLFWMGPAVPKQRARIRFYWVWPQRTHFRRRRVWREKWRLVLMSRHHLAHKKSHIRRANPKKIRRYQKRRESVVLRRTLGRGVQVFWATFSFGVSFGILFGSWWLYQNVFVDLPDIGQLEYGKQNMTTKILDRNNHLLFEIYEDENRIPIALSEVSPDLINATIAIEDRTFYEHKGFDLKAIVRAFLANQESGTISQGASTITQQLVKQRLLSPEKTFIRKMREVVLSVLVEENYTKQQILEMYLNQVNYGGPVYGVEQAAVTFFGKNAKDLTLAESAFLAGLPQAPSRYSPYANDLEGSYKRRSEVLRRMEEDGYITSEQRAQADAEELVFNKSRVKIEAPHFVMYVRSLLADIYGEDMVNTGGMVVRTSLDLELQNVVQKIVTAEVDGLTGMRVSNGAAMVVKPGTGEILAMVGSRDYFDFENDGQVNVTTRLRQPGSSIKPVTYATAMEYNGFTPATLILDQPIVYRNQWGQSYAPKNYDGSYHGNVTLRQSLGCSYNIPAVKVLNEIGMDAMIDQAERMGITTWEDRSRFGLSLTLGGGEVRMTDMMSVYSTFANAGVTVEQDPFLEILDYKGRTIYQNTCALFGECANRQHRSLSAATAYQIDSILSDNDARAPAFGVNSVLNIPGQEVAVKTGTTNSLRDNWTFGYTNDYVVGTWVGNNNNTPMSYIASGITGASPMWQKIMLQLLDPENPAHFEVPAGIVKVAYCGREEYFKEGAVPREVCRRVIAQNPEGDNPGDSHEGQ